MLVGPLLGLESDTNYTVCFLTDKDTTPPVLIIDGASVNTVEKVNETPHGIFWRGTFKIAVKSKAYFVSYQIEVSGETLVDYHGRSDWAFYVPAKNENPRIVYGSCNGFSTADLHQKTADPYILWERMADMHQETPFSLLTMGGDQVYADSIWTDVPSCREWKELSKSKKLKKSATQKLKRELDRFYEDLYIKRWQNKSMSLMLASIPSLMMWDDHDIFDGWGSYPEDLQGCETYQAIFSAAKKYFELFQIRSTKNTTLLSNKQAYYSFGVPFRRFYILGLDNRSQRTLSQIMHDDEHLTDTHWTRVISQLQNVEADNLLVMTGLPVVYRDLSAAESLFDFTPWQEELTDDIKDHWRAKEHQGERLRLIEHLLDCHKRRVSASQSVKKTVILSGDVHVACLGAIIDRRVPGAFETIHQIVSSGIVHPPPSAFDWAGISTISHDDNEFLYAEKTVETLIIQAVGADKYIRTRNFSYLVEGDDGHLWANWVCEMGRDAEYPLM